MTKQEILGAKIEFGLSELRLKTGYSVTMPPHVELSTRFSRNVGLKVPFVCAAMEMDEWKMATALAKFGGLGIIHRNLTPEAQAKEVARVKFDMNGLIAKPITVFGDETIEAIEDRSAEKRYKFRSFPVLDRNGKFIGMLTSSDFEFCRDRRHRAEEIMTRIAVTAEPGINVPTAFDIMCERKKKALPLIDPDGRVKGMYVWLDVKNIMTGNSSGYNTDINGQLRVGAAIGAGENAIKLENVIKRAVMLVEAGADVLVIDTGHADSLPVYETLKELRRVLDSMKSKTDIVVGNISEGCSAKRLVGAGADGIKVGQGPGSICTTRLITGYGRPQASAVCDCAEAVKGSDVPVCADGGIENSGDIGLVLGLGADSAMMGRVFAGADEAPGEPVSIGGVLYMMTRGMGSLEAMAEHEGSRNRYHQEDGGKSRIVPEGVKGFVPCEGPVIDILYQLDEGVRRGMGGVGAKNIAELKEKAEFNRCTEAGTRESHPHGIQHIQDAPNYKVPERRE